MRSAWSDAHAQAWVGDKGALDLSMDYNFATSDKVVVDKGSDFPNAGTTTHQFTLGGEYVPVPHLAVNVALPLVLLKYTGMSYPHPGGGSYDDGSTHTTLTDLHSGSRVLDVAAGNGNVSLAAARRFADVTSTDYVPSLLEAGKRRAEAEGLTIHFQEADAENLLFPDASFDVVTSTFGVMFAPNQAKAGPSQIQISAQLADHRGIG